MDAVRDENFVPVLLGVSSADGVTPIAIKVNPVSGRVLVEFDGGAGAGDMTAAVYDPAAIEEQVVGLTAIQTLTNKTLTSPVLTTPQINDTTGDHQYIIAVSELAADRTITLPLLGGNDVFVFADFAQTLTNKTLNSPVLTTPQINDSTADHQYVFVVSELVADRNVTLPVLAANDVFVFEAHVQTLTNKTLTSPVLTTPQINDTTGDHQYIIAVSELAADRTISLPLLGASDTFVFADFIQTLTNKTLTAPVITSPVLTTPQINDTSSDHQYIVAVSELTADRTITLPLLTGNDTFIFADFAATLANKTLTSPVVNGNLSGDAFLDEDNFASNSATKVASQQSIKAYVDTSVAAVSRTLQQAFDAGQSITIANNDNQTLSLINNDTTNNTTTFSIENDGTGNLLFLNQDGNGVAINIDTEATSADAINIDAVNTSGVVVDVNLVPGAASTAVAVSIANTGANASTGNVLEVENDGTGTAVYIQQDGILGASKYALHVYSNAAQTGDALARFHSDNALSDEPVLEIINDGTGTALYIEQNGVSGAADQYALKVYSNADQDNIGLVLFHQDNAGGDTSSEVLRLVQDAGGGGMSVFVNNGGLPAISIEMAANSANQINGLSVNLNNAGAGLENFCYFGGSEVVSSAVGGSQDKKVRVSVAGTTYFIPLHTS